jgi:hypothetical protein
MFSALNPSLYPEDWATKNEDPNYNEEDIPEFYRCRKLRPSIPFGQPQYFIQGRHSSIECHVVGIQDDDVICIYTCYSD